jgi:DNA repair protein RadC
MIYLKDSKIPVDSPQQVARVFRDVLMLEDAIDRDKEHFYVMHLDSRNRVKLVELVSIGTLNNAIVHPRETFRRAVMQGSASIIVGHNHPSRECEPSEEDHKVTTLLFEAGNILGIQMLDHLIFTPSQFFSFRDNRTHPMKDSRDSARKEVKEDV